uniref:Uncharacterized protein n=1 Tax=Peronospora matthiolae TaxID=2874970 RepID=A0AAV1V1L5_9STRA
MREFTGPKSKNRIDYCLASIEFYDKFVRSSSHLLGTKFGGADHVPAEFSASSHSPTPSNSQPFKCPAWLLKCDQVQDQLFCNLKRLASVLDPSKNPGCLLDEHKRRDRFFFVKNILGGRMLLQVNSGTSSGFTGMRETFLYGSK